MEAFRLGLNERTKLSEAYRARPLENLEDTVRGDYMSEANRIQAIVELEKVLRRSGGS